MIEHRSLGGGGAPASVPQPSATPWDVRRRGLIPPGCAHLVTGGLRR
ncbi:MAG: hypothetical protein ACETVR_04675 [Candidatus Bathyarchaeia archaeon]